MELEKVTREVGEGGGGTGLPAVLLRIVAERNFAQRGLCAAAGRLGATVITAGLWISRSKSRLCSTAAWRFFTDDNPAASPSDFTATIDWGDGSPQTAGSISFSSAAFVVSGQHTSIPPAWAPWAALA